MANIYTFNTPIDVDNIDFVEERKKFYSLTGDSDEKYMVKLLDDMRNDPCRMLYADLRSIFEHDRRTKSSFITSNIVECEINNDKSNGKFEYKINITELTNPSLIDVLDGIYYPDLSKIKKIRVDYGGVTIYETRKFIFNKFFDIELNCEIEAIALGDFYGIPCHTRWSQGVIYIITYEEIVHANIKIISSCILDTEIRISLGSNCFDFDTQKGRFIRYCEGHYVEPMSDNCYERYNEDKRFILKKMFDDGHAKSIEIRKN